MVCSGRTREVCDRNRIGANWNVRFARIDLFCDGCHIGRGGSCVYTVTRLSNSNSIIPPKQPTPDAVGTDHGHATDNKGRAMGHATAQQGLLYTQASERALSRVLARIMGDRPAAHLHRPGAHAARALRTRALPTFNLLHHSPRSCQHAQRVRNALPVEAQRRGR